MHACMLPSACLSVKIRNMYEGSLSHCFMMLAAVLPLAYSALRKNKAKTALPTRPVARQQST
eukprot:1157862-Pelagomonas_calceolata.AAC.9